MTPSSPPTGITSADRGHPPPERPGGGRLDDTVDLLGLDLGDLVTDGELGPVLDEPVDEAALGHRQAPLGHAELLDAAALAHAVAGAAAPVVSRTARAIASAVGT